MTKNAGLPSELAAWVGDRGYSGSERVSGGRNNRIYKVSGRAGTAALKVYFRGVDDRRDRFAAERTFYKLAAERDAASPRWLDADEELGASLLTWIEGAPVAVADEAGVRASAEFLVGINTCSPVLSEIHSEASEACFSVTEHCALLEKRLSKITEASGEIPALQDFLGSTLIPFTAAVRKHLESSWHVDFSTTGWHRILSPGDFGLHNALRDQTGRMVFFDFEYSGWDDPVKTVADVFLQPEKPVDWKLLPGFCAQLEAWSGLEERVRVWLPFFAAKWAVILLGPVSNDAAERRRFAGEPDNEALVGRQIEKAQHVIGRVNEFLL